VAAAATLKRFGSGADVLALDQDPDAVRHVTERLAHLGRRIIVRQANFRHADCVLDELGIRTIGGALLDLGVSSRQLENAERGSVSCETVRWTCGWTRDEPHRRDNCQRL